MSESKIIKCNTIPYRKGFIEVEASIHPGCINIETWDIHPEKDISSSSSVGSAGLSDSDVTGVTEIELNIKEAESLISLLQKAVSDVNNAKN